MTRLTEPAEEVDALFACLARRRCRFVLAYFHEYGRESATVRELIDSVIDRESPTPDRESVAISLRHTHLPAMAATDVITYDTDRDEVAITDRTATMVSQLSALPRTERVGVAIE